jgi:hypothetical protein
MKKSLLSFAALIIGVVGTSAQECPYPFQVLNQEYTDLVESTTVNGPELWDDPIYTIPLGFDFLLFNTTISEIVIIPPGAQLVNSMEAKSVEVLIPYLNDLMNASATEMVSPISYVLEGTEGNYIFKLEYKNAGFYLEFEQLGTFANTTNFQIWLHQNGNVIEYHYGPNTIKDGSSIQFFGIGPAVMIGTQVIPDGSGWAGLWSLAGDPANPSLLAVPSGTQMFTQEQVLTGEPASGTVYRFGELPVGVEEEELELELELEQELVIWPTASTNVIHFYLEENQAYTIYNSLGQIVKSTISANNVVTEDVSTLATGTYLIRTETGKIGRFIR